MTPADHKSDAGSTADFRTSGAMNLQQRKLFFWPDSSMPNDTMTGYSAQYQSSRWG